MEVNQLPNSNDNNLFIFRRACKIYNIVYHLGGDNDNNSFYI